MAPARPLRDVFADLIGDPSAADDPAALLRDQGHPGLPDHLVAEAVVSYADTAPVEVAEHLAPYVTAHSAVGADPVPGDEPPAGWLDLLGTAPDVVRRPADIDDLAPAPDEFDDAAGLTTRISTSTSAPAPGRRPSIETEPTGRRRIGGSRTRSTGSWRSWRIPPTWTTAATRRAGRADRASPTTATWPTSR